MCNERKPKLEDTKKAYDELISELNQEIENKKNKLKRMEIDRIKLCLISESYASIDRKLTEEYRNKAQDKCDEIRNSNDKTDIRTLENRIQSLEEYKEKTFKNE